MRAVHVLHYEIKVSGSQGGCFRTQPWQLAGVSARTDPSQKCVRAEGFENSKGVKQKETFESEGERVWTRWLWTLTFIPFIRWFNFEILSRNRLADGQFTDGSSKQRGWVGGKNLLWDRLKSWARASNNTLWMKAHKHNSVAQAHPSHQVIRTGSFSNPAN